MAMTIHYVNAAQEAAADFALLVAEATRVLADMALDPDARAEGLDTLYEIHAEATEFVSIPGLPSALQGLFSSILALGTKVAETSGPLAETTLAQVHVIESLTRSIAAGLDSPEHDRTHIQAIVRNVAALTSASPTASDLYTATDAARAALERFVTNWTP
jgi:ribosome-associated translation inhibitor RaiA